MALCLFTRDRYLPQVDHHHHDHPHHYPPLYWQTYTPSSQTHNSSWIDEKNGMTQSLHTHPPPQHDASPVSPSHAFSHPPSLHPLPPLQHLQLLSSLLLLLDWLRLGQMTVGECAF